MSWKNLPSWLKVVIIIIFVGVMTTSLIVYKSIIKEECKINSDCDFSYTTYGESSCVSCHYADKEWICMNKEKAEQEKNRIIEESFNGFPPLCERCLEDDYETYYCKCTNNKCVKERTIK